MRRDIFDFNRLQQEMNKLFENFFRDDDSSKMLGTQRNNSLISNFKNPRSDVYETENEVIADIEMPGVDKKDIKLQVRDRTLSVRAEKTHKREENDKKGYYYSERSYTGFQRNIPLPNDVDEKNVKAEFKNGVLHVKIPKSKEGKDAKYIDIS